LLTLTLPPLGWWPLGPVGVAVLALVLLQSGWRGRLVLGLGAGLGLYGPGLWWATEFHAVGWVLLVVVESLLFAGAVGLARWPVALPPALVVLEAVRGHWPFGGLPLAGLDLGQVNGPLLGSARVGTYLCVVGVMATAGVGLAQAARRRVVPAVVGLGLAVLAALSGSMAPDGKPAGTVAVAAVQGGGERGVRAVDSDEAAVLDRHLAASRRIEPGAAALILWPEDVIDLDGEFAGSAEERAVASLARELGATVVVGVVEEVDGDPPRFRNASVVFGPDGAVVDRYDKVHRVPFGEYVPFRSVVDKVADVSAIPRDALAGRGAGAVDTAAGRMAVTISYEVYFADRARSGVAAGGRLLLVPTNASSYTTSQVPSQEVAVARVRAVETGRWTVQAAPTGYSAVIDHRGRVRAQGTLGSAEVLTRTVGLRTGRTLAVRLGETPAVVAAGAILALPWVRFGARQRPVRSFPRARIRRS